jgi:hypothetical protein
LALAKTTKTGGFGHKTRNFYLLPIHFEQVTKDEQVSELCWHPTCFTLFQ